jgi:fibro-slime domain-containing protein
MPAMTKFPHALTALTLALLAGASSVALAQAGSNGGEPNGGGDEDTVIRSNTQGDAYAHLPASISMKAVIRDFRGSLEENGHPDFEAFVGWGACVGLIEPTLDADNKPALKSTTGTFTTMVNTRIRPGRMSYVNPALFDSSRGDQSPVTMGEFTAITSNDTFHQWYRDIPGVNMSTFLTIALHRQPGTDRYVVDSATDQPWASLGGFFPVNNSLFGASTALAFMQPNGTNFHFTSEISATFTYRQEQNQVFTFAGDDDVWVFIDGKLVIDLGGTHGRVEQSIDLDRLALTNNTDYQIRIFHAERHASESNLRIETNLQLRGVEAPQISALCD